MILSPERVTFDRVNDTIFLGSRIASLDDYHRDFGLTSTRLRRAADDAIVMHPGPMNRGVEISDEVADGPQSRVLRQVANGVAVRMAVLEALLSD